MFLLISRQRQDTQLLESLRKSQVNQFSHNNNCFRKVYWIKYLHRLAVVFLKLFTHNDVLTRRFRPIAVCVEWSAYPDDVVRLSQYPLQSNYNDYICTVTNRLQSLVLRRVIVAVGSAVPMVLGIAMQCNVAVGQVNLTLQTARAPTLCAAGWSDVLPSWRLIVKWVNLTLPRVMQCVVFACDRQSLIVCSASAQQSHHIYGQIMLSPLQITKMLTLLLKGFLVS